MKEKKKNPTDREVSQYISPWAQKPCVGRETQHENRNSSQEQEEKNYSFRQPKLPLKLKL